MVIDEISDAVSVPAECRFSAVSVPAECRLSAARVPTECRLGAIGYLVYDHLNILSEKSAFLYISKVKKFSLDF